MFSNVLARKSEFRYGIPLTHAELDLIAELDKSKSNIENLNDLYDKGDEVYKKDKAFLAAFLEE